MRPRNSYPSVLWMLQQVVNSSQCKIKKIILMRINFSFIVGRIFLIRILNRTWMNFFLILSQSDDIKFCVNIQFFLISFVLFWFGNIARKFKKKNLRMGECKRTLEGHFCCDFFFTFQTRFFCVYAKVSGRLSDFFPN